MLKKAALALAVLMAWLPRLDRRTADRVTRVIMSRLLYTRGGEGGVGRVEQKGGRGGLVWWSGRDGDRTA